ncbi:TetR/AcrR family transcriptional regulator [Gordonia malaquae]|uniref:TetR/AcrR family transcriptional regulator n=1 Tax=Gordonia malaquae TaxID=410332 RepID=UPI0030C78B2C
MSTPTDRTSRRRDRRKAEMIQAALALLSAHGYHGMRFEDVAERADIAKASLYYYFPSKDQLVAEALAKLTDDVVGRLSTALEPLNGAPATARFRVLVDTQLDILTVDYPEVGAIFSFPAPWPAEHATAIKAMRRTHDTIFRDVVDAGVASGEFTTTAPAVALHCLHGMLNHASLWLDPTSDADRRQRDAVVDAALRLFV